MPGRCSKAFGTSVRLLPQLLLMLLAVVNGSAERSYARVEESTPNPLEKLAASESTAQMPTDPQVTAVQDKMTSAGIGRPVTVADVRKAYLFYAELSGLPEHVYRIENRDIPGPAGNLTTRVYTPNSGTALPILVFFHGGGFVAGDLDTYDNPLRSVTNRCECIVVSVAYRLAPKNKYPAAPEDAYAATKWVAEHANSINGDSQRIAVGGDGAGGNLAAVVTLMARERGTPHLVFQVLIYPMLGASTMRPSWFTETDIHTVTREAKHKMLSAYLPIAVNLGDPHISPIRADTLAGLPPALLIVYGGDDPTRAEGEDYAHRLTQDSVAASISIYPEVIHGFFLMAGELDAGKKCIDEIGSALKTGYAGSSRPAK
jgi:acetyl esterase